MQIKTNRQSIVSETSPSSSSSTSPASASSSLVCLDNNRIRKQIKCNMLLELNTINAKKNINTSPGSNYTDIACNHSCGCMLNSSCSHSAYCCCSACATAAAYCHSNCCQMSPSTKDNSNYMHCANGSRIAFNMYTPTVASDNSASTNNSCKNNEHNVDNRDCSSVGECNSFQRAISNINSNLNGLIKFATILIFLAICDSSQAALNNVNLFIEPPAVRRSQSVILRCQYILEGAPLYSVKFYRGQLEFFRYTPGEYPNTKVFHYPGIKVDESVSNATQVVIRNVNFGLSGNFSCEVTADAPLFSTATAYAQMQVVEFPDKRPQLLTEHTRYEPGDVLRANCSTPPSRPRAELRFTINNIPVSSEETQYIRTVDNLIASRLSLKVQLQSVHFAAAAAAVTGVGSNAGSSNSHMTNALSPGGTVGIPTTYIGGSGASGGPLLLRCTAQIGDLYQEYKEIELGTPQKDPVPARVTSSDGGFRGFLETYFGPSSGANPSTDRLQYKILLINCLLIVLHVTLSDRR